MAEDSAAAAITPQERAEIDSRAKQARSLSITLEHEWTFWFDEGQSKGTSEKDFAAALKELGTFNSIQGFWRYWNSLMNVSQFPESSNLYLFKKGVKPLWEDPENANGGKWVIRSPKETTATIMADLVLALIGEQLSGMDDLVGVVLSVRNAGDMISLWNKDCTAEERITKMLQEVKGLISIPIIIDYKAHATAIRRQHAIEDRRRRIEGRRARRVKNRQDRRTRSTDEHDTEAGTAGDGDHGHNGEHDDEPSRQHAAVVQQGSHRQRMEEKALKAGAGGAIIDSTVGEPDAPKEMVTMSLSAVRKKKGTEGEAIDGEAPKAEQKKPSLSIDESDSDSDDDAEETKSPMGTPNAWFKETKRALASSGPSVASTSKGYDPATVAASHEVTADAHDDGEWNVVGEKRRGAQQRGGYRGRGVARGGARGRGGRHSDLHRSAVHRHASGMHEHGDRIGVARTQGHGGRQSGPASAHEPRPAQQQQQTKPDNPVREGVSWAAVSRDPAAEERERLEMERKAMEEREERLREKERELARKEEEIKRAALEAEEARKAAHSAAEKSAAAAKAAAEAHRAAKANAAAKEESKAAAAAPGSQPATTAVHAEEGARAHPAPKEQAPAAKEKKAADLDPEFVKIQQKADEEIRQRELELAKVKAQEAEIERRKEEAIRKEREAREARKRAEEEERAARRAAEAAAEAERVALRKKNRAAHRSQAVTDEEGWVTTGAPPARRSGRSNGPQAGGGVAVDVVAKRGGGTAGAADDKQASVFAALASVPGERDAKRSGEKAGGSKDAPTIADAVARASQASNTVAGAKQRRKKSTKSREEELEREVEEILAAPIRRKVNILDLFIRLAAVVIGVVFAYSLAKIIL